MSEISVTLPDGSVRRVPAGATPADVAAEISPRLAKAALAAIVDDRLVDLTYALQRDARVRLVTSDSPEALDLYRHSTAHLMAAAVTSLFPGAQCGIGPAIDDGFFYDFVVDRPFVPEDLDAIERKMKERLKAFKLLNTSNAYWKGDARNQAMQRIYGTAFLTQKDLDAHLHRIEEAKKRDHRKIGRELGLFWFHPWAPGEPFWLPKGTTLVHLLGNYMRSILFPAGYVEVRAPLVFNKALWERSGHWAHYRDNMFLIESRDEEEQAGLKPMNCPGHMLLFASEVRSYRELPLRIHEQSVLHRMEASGVLSGLTRVREFIMDDAHIFLREDQIGEEVERLLRLVQRVYDDFGLTPEMKLSTRPAEFLGEISTWDHAESELKKALDTVGVAYTINEGDGAFYGPKIDFAVTDALGRKWQCATVQLDYQLPQQFELKYIGADNAEHRPVVIHRAIFGSFERFIALLLEHYAGALPLWISPVQATVLPIADRHVDYARSVRDRLAAAGLRVEVDERQEKIGYKIREAQLQKIPYMLVVGDREAGEGTISVRTRTGGDQGSRLTETFITDAQREIVTKGRPDDAAAA
jgi:threonyl-tRNA synthetase